MGNVRKIPALIHCSKYLGFAIRIFHAILLLLTEYDAILHHIDC